MDKKLITVFTPTYNRSYLLPRLYESLCQQTSQDFLWMVIDDGSTENTKELIESWMIENRIEIQYFYKENGGMHTGHNLAYTKIATELNTCIDSDDYMPNDAVEKIINRWNSVKDKTKIAGIIGLDAYYSGQIIGDKIPEHLQKGNLTDLYLKHHLKGDKKVILRTDIVRQYPMYPEYKHEKLVPLDTLYTLIGNDYDFVYSNDVYCHVEYQEGGSTKTIFKQYKQSARGFGYARKIQIQFEPGFLNRCKNYIHLVSSSIFLKNWRFAFQGVNPLMSFVLWPLGFLWNLYIQKKINA